MISKQVTLQEMLTAREERARIQGELLTLCQKPLICFTMNIAGPVKTNAWIARGFRYGCELLNSQLSEAGIPCLRQMTSAQITGETAWLVADGDPQTLKRLTAEIEDGFPVGRLYDMDVLDANGRHIGREELGLPERSCLLCGNPAKECARNRTHSVAALWEYTNRLLREEFQRQDREKIAELACRSLLYEVCTTPKPGLVDCENSGSHRDMDIFTFMSSTAALYPYFEHCAMTGMETADAPARETFQRLRWHGKRAEFTMKQATRGVNTHKGAIFSIGVFCGALGRLPRDKWKEPDAVLSECAAMTEGLTNSDYSGVTEQNASTTGQRLFARYGITGVRGQAEEGFPAVKTVGLPTLMEGLQSGLSLNDAGCGTLLALIVATVDTNLIARGDLVKQQAVADEIAMMRKKVPFPGRNTLQSLDRKFVSQNLSPGGSADLLAMTYFLYFLLEE